MKKPYKMPNNYSLAGFDFHIKNMKMASQIPTKIKKAYNLSSEVFDRFVELSSIYKDHPIYCVRQSLIDDMEQTDVNENIPLFLDISLSIPYFVLVFPKKTIESPLLKDGKIAYLEYMIVKLEETSDRSPESEEFKYIFKWGAVDTQDRVIYSYKRIRRNGTFKRSFFSIDDQGCQDRTIRLSNIVLQSILLLEYYPEIQENMQLTDLDADRKGFRKTQNKCNLFRLPRWLGNQAKRNNDRYESGGSGSPKSTHFRRGFWRSQPIGKNRSDRKVIYIEPVWIHKNS